MVKVQLNIRVEPYLLELIGHLANTISVGNKTALIETAIKEFCEKTFKNWILIWIGQEKMKTKRHRQKNGI